MSNKVWLLTSGVYSDYRVEAAFTDKQTAEKAAELENSRDKWEEFRIEQYDLYDELPDRVTVWKAHQTVYEDGAVDVLEVTAQHGFEWNQYVLPYKNGRPRLQQGNWFSIGKKRLNVYAYGWDRESAVKAVVDRVAAIRADQLGVS